MSEGIAQHPLERLDDPVSLVGEDADVGLTTATKHDAVIVQDELDLLFVPLEIEDGHEFEKNPFPLLLLLLLLLGRCG